MQHLGAHLSHAVHARCASVGRRPGEEGKEGGGGEMGQGGVGAGPEPEYAAA